MTGMKDPYYVLAMRSIKWRTTGGWVIICILVFRYLAYPIANMYAHHNGLEPFPPLEPLSISDVLAVIGLPAVGAFADKMKEE